LIVGGDFFVMKIIRETKNLAPYNIM
jgi:hypothetical protein